MSVRQLATSLSGPMVAAGEFEHRVHIWDVVGRKHRASIDTILDFGGHRLAITEDGLLCFAAAYHVEGIAAYSTVDGAVIWRRKELRKVQSIRPAVDGRRLFCAYDAKACHVLECESGRILRTWPGVRGVWESPYEPLTLLEKRGLVLEAQGGPKVATIARASFAVLSVAFAPGFVCVSESAGPLRCFDTKNGSEIWRATGGGEHVLDLAFAEHAGGFVGVCWSYERSGPQTLRRFELGSGASTVLADLGPTGEFGFCLRGSRLLSSDGSLFDTGTGRRTGRLDFGGATAGKTKEAAT